MGKTFSASVVILDSCCDLLDLPLPMLGWQVKSLLSSKCFFMSTSAVVRKDTKDCLISDDGGRWSVKLDVRDFGGHLDVTCWS